MVNDKVMQPYGGTEIQFDYLKKYTPLGLTDAGQITTSIPEKIPLDPIRANILWQKNSWDQPNITPWFKDKNNHSKYDWYVFNSHWNYENFRKHFGIPEDKCAVIKNAIDYEELVIKKDFTPKPKIKMCYISTPWRGLEIALNAMEVLKNKEDIELDVYSSTIIYGTSFYKGNDKSYEHLYKKCEELPNVNYKGYLKHNELVGKLHEYDINCFPSIWEETFCISAMESLAAGCLLITTDLGALPETCSEFPVYIPYTSNKKSLTLQLVEAILQSREMLKNDISWGLKFQQEYYKRFYDWKIIGKNWENFLKGALLAKRKQQ